MSYQLANQILRRPTPLQQRARGFYTWRRLATTIGSVGVLLLAAMGGSAHRAAGATACQITVPAVWAADEPGEVYTGHARGSCTFRWHLTQQIEYKDRWHILGTTEHGPYAAGAQITVPSDEHTYAPRCGWWRVRDVVRDDAGNQRWAATGTESWFCT